MKAIPWVRWNLCGLVLALAGCANLAGPPPLRAATPDPLAGNGVANIAGVQKAGLLDMVRNLQAQSQHYAALAHLQAHDSRWGPSADSQLLRAGSLMATDQDAEARTLFLQLTQGDLAGTAHHGLGLLAARRGQLDEAIAAFERAARLQPTDAVVLGDLGYALLQRGRWAQARNPLFTAAELAPQDARALANLALYHHMTGNPELAERLLASPGIGPEARDKVRALAAARTGAVDGRETFSAPPR